MINETLTIQESKEIIDYYSSHYPLSFKAMHFLGFGGVATAGQVFRWLNFYESDQRKCLLVIADLIGKNLIRKLNRFQLNKINQPENEVIFYVTEKGFNDLKSRCLPEDLIRHDSDLIARQVKYGTPKNTKLYRVNHELLLAESILYWLDEHEFIFIKTEPKLISEYYKSWYDEQKREWKSMMGKNPPKGFLKSPPGRSFPDYQIHVLTKNDGEFWRWNCEIVNNMTLKQINRKTDINFWFCNTEQSADFIKTSKNRHPVQLNNLSEPTWVRDTLQAEFYSKNTVTEAQENLLNRIACLGGVVSCKLLASLGNKKDSYYRTQLEALHRQQKLNKISTCLVPGVSRGNNENFYSLEGFNIESNDELKKAVMRAYLITTATSQGFKFEDYSSKFDGCIFSKSNRTCLFLVDYEFITVEENIQRIENLQRSNPSVIAGIGCLDKDRVKTYFNHFGKSIAIWKLYDLKNAKSYRYVRQLNPRRPR